MKDRDVIRVALIDAIEWEQSLWGAYAHVNTKEGKAVKRRCETRIAEFKRLLSFSYGGLPEDPTKGSKSINIRDMR